ncbi:recombinase RecT [Bordetella hinzii]|uniref:recombinase RecT n=1 Tax=Bordetella hinzii TaxID=103855 RepID=UPI003F1BA2E6
MHQPSPIRPVRSDCGSYGLIPGRTDEQRRAELEADVARDLRHALQLDQNVVFHFASGPSPQRAADFLRESGIRDASQGWKQAKRYGKTENTPWGAHYAEMGRKTVLRRLFKYLPVSIELANAAALDELNARGESQALDNVLEGDYITPAPGDDTDDAPAVTAPAFDPAPILQQITEADSVDALDLVADSFRDAPDEHYDALKKAYDARRAALEPAA